jgi:hypothetical protein
LLARIIVQTLAVLCAMALLTASGWISFRTWPRPIPLAAQPIPSVQFDHGNMVVPLATKALLAEVGRFDNEISAYLWFDYLRSRPGIDGSQVLLTVNEKDQAPIWVIEVVLPNDALVAIPFLAQLEAQGFIEGFDLVFTVPSQVEKRKHQTSLFVATYRRPVEDRLETLPREQLLPATARFLAFKSQTDPRVRASSESRPSSLSHEQAIELAADIVAVADFYDLPLDVFLGIGAMENNYLSTRGDVDHAIWKRKPAKDDIILKRRRGRVLVSDYSVGVWQITRETLRYVHSLYLKDKRDYSQLPERLRPPKVPELDVTDSHVLTTYAGLLLRDLLDRFNGDIEKAVGAYNGGPRNPNAEYAAGVQLVAVYARNILERVTATNDQATVESLERGMSASPDQLSTSSGNPE